MMQSARNLLLMLIAVGHLAFLSSCSEEEDATPNPVEDGKAVELANDGDLGSYLVNQDGRALYFFSKDVGGNSECTGGCLESWPIFFDENLEIGGGLNNADFGTITRSDGQKQTTYKGWPLYYYSGDSGANAINGDGVGKVWFVAKPDYTLMLATQPVTGIGSDPVPYLVDAKGNSLYYFLNDDENISNCADGCLQAWPAFQEVSDIVLPSTLNKSAFSVIVRQDGLEQLVYAGRPIYFFAQDSNRGETNGATVPNWTISQLPQ